MAINKLILNVESIDEETGEITTQELDVTTLIVGALGKKTTTVKKKSSSSKIEENDTPIVRLEENKYILTSGAIAALDAEPGETRLVIRFQKIGDFTIPVIGTNETFGIKSGNKLTLSGSVSCRGKANEELADFGNEFILVKHPSAEGMFIMTQDGTIPEGDYTISKKKATKKEVEEEEPEVVGPQPEPEEDYDTSDLDDLLGEVDAVEVTDDDFTL